LKRRVKVVLVTSAVAIAVAGAGAVVASSQSKGGVQVGDCVSHSGYKSVSCDAGKNQLRIVSVGIVGCEATNRMTLVVKDRRSYCAVDTKPGSQPVINEGDCVKRSTTSTTTTTLVKALCTDKDAHQIVKKIAGSANKADCPTTAPKALINKSLNYVLCFKS
jgi:hypothetical protein